MRALMVSNGSGEDRIAVALARAWQKQEPDLELEALALVGKGDFYTEAQIPLRPVQFSPPSEGFAYLHPGLLWQDLRGGLGRHLQSVWQELGRIQ